MSANTPEFIQKQYEFTSHCRDPENNPAPSNIEDRRMGIYRELLYNNVEGFMANNFPVIREILSDDQWHKLVREYFANHKATTPLFPKLPFEFVQFLEKEHEPDPAYPFLYEMAHYEWAESVLATDVRDINFSDVVPEGDLLSGIPITSELIWLLAYDYPVHQISPEFVPQEKPAAQTYLVVYRDREDEVGFMELNPVTARLLECLIANEAGLTGQAILQAIAEELQHPQPEVVINGGLQILQQMLQRDVILGVRG